MSPEPSGVVATITGVGGEMTWPETELPPGRYHAEWANDCTISLFVQGATVINLDDPRVGSSDFTIEPNHHGSGATTICNAEDRITVRITKP